MKRKIKGADKMFHTQKNTVFEPTISISEKGVNVKLIGMTLEIYPPSVVTKFSAIKRVGPTTRTNNNKIPAIIIFVLLSIFIPLSIPLVAEKIKRIVTIIITIICTHALLGRGVR